MRRLLKPVAMQRDERMDLAGVKHDLDEKTIKVSPQ
jgi:hypothetical protein